MIRTAGMLLGSLLMLAFFLLYLDAGHEPRSVEPAAGSEPHVQTDTGGPATFTDAPVDPAEDLAEVPVPVAVDPAPAPGSGGKPARDDAGSGLLLDPLAWNQAMGTGDASVENDTATASRHLVWTPFRSQWAAEGFARRLTLATDVPVEVISEASGDYRVVIRYRDEAERQTMIRQIETVTGLELDQ